MSPHLPVTPDEIAGEALAAAEAGATVRHLHARDPETGIPDPSRKAFARFLPRIKQASNAAINVTTGDVRAEIPAVLLHLVHDQPFQAAVDLQPLFRGAEKAVVQHVGV